MNRTEIRVVGMSRSGNHALINWLLKQLEGSFCFLNCAEPKFSPFLTARPMDDGACFTTNIPGFDLGQERQGRFSRKDWLIHSYEDCFLGPLGSPRWQAQRERWAGRSERRIDVLVLRDPYNLFASRIRRAIREKHYEGEWPPPRELALHRRIWKQHARQALGQARLFRGEWLPVFYNRWIADSDYRRSIAAQLGTQFSDSGFHEVPSCAGGSSFDGLGYHQDAGSMQLQDRWRHFIDEPAFRDCFDAATHAFAQEAFPDVHDAVADALVSTEASPAKSSAALRRTA